MTTLLLFYKRDIIRTPTPDIKPTKAVSHAPAHRTEMQSYNQHSIQMGLALYTALVLMTAEPYPGSGTGRSVRENLRYFEKTF